MLQAVRLPYVFFGVLFFVNSSCGTGDTEQDCRVTGDCNKEPVAQITCTPDDEERKSCDACGIHLRTCAEDSLWSGWSICPDIPNPNEEPTWEDPIDNLMQRRCVSCHIECRGYTSTLRWVEDGSLQEWTEINHYIYGKEKKQLLRWIEIDAPKTDCDIVYK